MFQRFSARRIPGDATAASGYTAAEPPTPSGTRARMPAEASSGKINRWAISGRGLPARPAAQRVLPLCSPIRSPCPRLPAPLVGGKVHLVS